MKLLTDLEHLIDYHNFSDTNLQSEIISSSSTQTINKNDVVIREGQFIKWFIIVLEGKIRVWHESENKQITLYKIGKFETCAYSIVAIGKQYQAMVNAIVVSDTATILKIPLSNLKEWKKYHSWQKFMSETLIGKYENLLGCIHKLAFKKVDERLLEFLRKTSERTKSDTINISHNKLANEIGSTREVVSRTLKNFEKKGDVELEFKKIKLKKI